jgi:glycosyltransferase involved in cell wall biosynthesis
VLEKPLNVFYEEPNPDRWFKYDRYPRKLIRRIIRGKERPGGVMMVALNLIEGLKRLNVPYRFNDYSYIRKHPDETACIIGKPHLLFEKKWTNPVILGAGIFSHPSDFPNILKDHPNVKRLLVPGDWMVDMFKPYYGDKVTAWPTGIDTNKWHPMHGNKTFDFLIYDKVKWDQEQHHAELLSSILKTVTKHGLSYQTITYGYYDHDELKEKLSSCKAAIFLSKSETQGLAYQQILSTNTPILAWNRGGYWEDPDYYPHRVRYQPVSSVPYWDGRCGEKFSNAADFEESMLRFLNQLHGFKPREYIMENLTLEICAAKYLDIYQEVQKELGKP